MDHPTAENKRALLVRRAQVLFAERVLRRHQRITGVSGRGVELIARFEGFRADAYRDPVGVLTQGFGETKGVTPGKPWSRSYALRRLRQRIDRDFAPPVVALNLPKQQMVDAVVSLVYNVGPGVLEPGHSIGDALRARDWPRSADAFLLYDKAAGRRLEGLSRRRHAERALFLS